MRGLSLFVFIVEGEALQCQYERAETTPCGYAPVTFFVTDFCFRVAKICNRQAGAAPEYAEKGVDPHLQTHVSGILGSLLQKCRKK